MMIECPKCGFSQPQDRYCAKCGVDMENFKPHAPSVGKKVFSNPLIYIALAFVLFCLVVIFVRRHSKEEMASRVQFLKGGPILVARSNRMAKTAENAPPPPTLGNNPPVNAPVAVPPTSSKAVEATTPADPAKKSYGEAVRLHLFFAEVDHSTMESLRQDSRAAGQFTEFGDFKAGIIPAQRHATSERGVRVLYKVDEKMDHEHMSLSSVAGESKADGTYLGVTYSVALTHLEPNLIRGEIEVLQNFHESVDFNDPPIRRTYPSTTFELSPGQSWMVTLNLPTVPQEDGDTSSAEGIMRIFQSPQYKTKQTEFTLFFEFDTPTAK